ncbi:hypothetical protein J3A84_04825 [Proteiniclasticum sp. SCR006]|uniref:Uncharacterized protein n=1 Tax=Proteiniclasticum aestuarii TaxID=2817862 RepID=A0A939H8C2_9CLOT|nr:hypothetical protein [Proteiniclasticum aestuarii]MBO1264364.1 hypothetical protein [Proteiniclasticum aestuarii]
MPDIRKMLEKQLELLQEHSNIAYENNPAELTYAMIEIIDVLYPEGIPEASVVGEMKIKVSVDGFEVEKLASKNSALEIPKAKDLAIEGPGIEARVRLLEDAVCSQITK